MTESVVARRYAQAVFNLGKEAGGKKLDAFVNNLAGIADLLVASPTLGDALKNPVISIDEKKAVLGSMFERLQTEQLIRNFCFLLADRERLGYLAEIINCFHQLVDKERGILRGKLITAIELNSDKRSQIKSNLEAKAGSAIELDFAVDASILGGIVLQVGDKVLDASLRAQLALLRDTFKRGE